MKQGLPYFINKIEKTYPFTYIDVGAMGGISLKWKALLNHIKVIAFEPDEREFNKLKSNNVVKYFNYALYDKSQDLAYYIAKENGKSSIYKPNMDILCQYEDYERFQVVQEKIISSAKVKDLDSICEENSIKDIDFIKLDTQGSELPILSGGQKKAIPNMFGAQIEVEFVELYKDQPLFRDVDAFMQNKGFLLVDLKRQYWKRKGCYAYRGKGSLIFGDALYLKEIDIFYQELFNKQDKLYARSKIFKSILVCMIYKVFDYAVTIAKTGCKKQFLTDKEREEIILNIKKCSKSIIFPRFSLHRKLYGTINYVLKKFKPPSYLGWADSDDEIGNIKDA